MAVASVKVETDDEVLDRMRLIDQRVRAAEMAITRRASMVKRHALTALIHTYRQEQAVLEARRTLNALLREIEEDARG